jgi:hypothetical protein
VEKISKPIATIQIRGAGKMTKEDRKKLAGWLRRHATELVREGDQYSDTRFTARLYGL